MPKLNDTVNSEYLETVGDSNISYRISVFLNTASAKALRDDITQWLAAKSPAPASPAAAGPDILLVGDRVQVIDEGYYVGILGLHGVVREIDLDRLPNPELVVVQLDNGERLHFAPGWLKKEESVSAPASALPPTQVGDLVRVEPWDTKEKCDRTLFGKILPVVWVRDGESDVLVIRGDGKGHHVEGFQDAWWIEAKYLAVVGTIRKVSPDRT
jgi:hypothetical protein